MKQFNSLSSGRIFLLTGLIGLSVHYLFHPEKFSQITFHQYFALGVLLVGSVIYFGSYYSKLVKSNFYSFISIMLVLGHSFFLIEIIDSPQNQRFLTAFMLFSALGPWYFENKRHLVGYLALLLISGLGLQYYFSAIWPLTFIYVYITQIGLTYIFVSSRIKAFKNLHTQEASFNKMVNELPIGVFQSDSFGYILGCNSFITEATGYELKQVKGKSWISTFCRESEREMVQLEIKKAKQSLEIRRFRTSWKTNTGKHIWVSISMIPQLRTNGNLQGFVYFVANHTETQLLEEELLLTQNEIGEHENFRDRLNNELNHMAKIASKDLQVPLIELEKSLKDYDSDEKDQQVLLDTIQSKSQQILNLVDALLIPNLSISETTRENVDLNDLIKEVQESLKTQIAVHNIHFVYEELPILRVNRLQILRLFRILIEYAMETRTSQRLTINISSSSESKNQCLITLADNGSGIAQHRYDELMQILKQANDTKANGRQPGIGACKQIVLQHEGKFWIKSTRGSGNTFYFTLPLAKTEVIPS